MVDISLRIFTLGEAEQGTLIQIVLQHLDEVVWHYAYIAFPVNSSFLKVHIAARPQQVQSILVTGTSEPILNQGRGWRRLRPELLDLIPHEVESKREQKLQWCFKQENYQLGRGGLGLVKSIFHLLFREVHAKRNDIDSFDTYVLFQTMKVKCTKTKIIPLYATDTNLTRLGDEILTIERIN